MKNIAIFIAVIVAVALAVWYMQSGKSNEAEKLSLPSVMPKYMEASIGSMTLEDLE